jgi:hypothetical protein
MWDDPKVRWTRKMRAAKAAEAALGVLPQWRTVQRLRLRLRMVFAVPYMEQSEGWFDQCASLGPRPPMQCKRDNGHRGLHHWWDGLVEQEARQPLGGLWWKDNDFVEDEAWRSAWQRSLGL